MKRLQLHHVIAWLLLVVMGLIVFHAPMTVFVASRWSGIGDIIKAWKEILILVALGLLVVAYARERRWSSLRRDAIVWTAGLYVALHLMLVATFPAQFQAAIAGLMIDLRYIAYFVAVYTFLKLYPVYRHSFLKLALWSAYFVVGFAVIQLILPHDFLKYVGYGDATIQPYLTVDKNPDYVRLQSTMRGPNPLGAYAVIVLAGVLSYLRVKRRDTRQLRVLALGFAAAVALWCSFSRSAVIGFIVVVGILAWSLRGQLTRRRQLAVVIGIVGISSLMVVALQGTSFWHNVVVHDNPTTGASIDSNQGHADSLRDGLARMAVQPLGAGVGSTGSASLYTDSPLIIENQYLFIAHEVGWMGLAVFLGFSTLVFRRLWRQRNDWKSYALFASGIALMMIGLMQPVWADDTVSLVWWGLAGVLYGMKGGGDGTTTNKKAA